jgi:hypothetical protein
MPRIKGCHSGENITKAVINMIKRMVKADKLGYFCADNAIINDLIIRLVLKRIRPNLKYPERRRVRCLGHIINLAAMAFLFGNDSASLEAEISDTTNSTILDAELSYWRKKGVKRKLYNLVYFIRKTLQRRERFFHYCKASNVINNEIKGI